MIERVRLMLKVSDGEIQPCVVIIVPERHTHPVFHQSMFAQCHAGELTLFLKLSIAIVVIEEVRICIVCDVQIRVPIRVVISEGSTQPTRRNIVKTRCLLYFL